MYLMKGFKHSSRSGQEYESVEDQRDLRIPVQNEDAFKHGIVYKTKYIGTQEITRPSSRAEIVSAMRRIRYEYKYRNIKKRKVNMDISVEGIRVNIWKKKRILDEGKFDSSQLFVMCYPINRVFYVSHDSQDLLIFSYIARGEDGIFRCSVFKAFKKSQAMNIVRTIGQAFEVCHKINVEKTNEDQELENRDATNIATSEEGQETNIDDVGETDIDDVAGVVEQGKADQLDNSGTFVTDIDKAGEGIRPTLVKPKELVNGEIGFPKDGTYLQWQQFYVQQLRLHQYESEAAKAEVEMLKQQLRIESETRRNAQARIEQLLSQNRELVKTLQKLMLQAQKTSAKDVFDPIDETWMVAPISDPFFPSTMPNDATPNKVTNECIAGVYGNKHHQSMDFDSPGIIRTPVSGPVGSAQKQSPERVPAREGQPVGTTAEDICGSFSDLRKDEASRKDEALQKDEASQKVEASWKDEATQKDEASQKDEADNDLAPAMLRSAGERIGGISSSFTDLTKVGVKDERVDMNHNADRITKFEKNEQGTSQEENGPVEAGNSAAVGNISKEMMETFSLELTELEGGLSQDTERVKLTQSSMTDL